eukprot:TRINITY_DN1853_c0_g1_i1.p1 TRINITY_DN1853_c0_g1~~TRINITY_DN1853_c0_g1_i1.p1  ORF type:complete len:617 (+),score=182.80 TRINITY_DN1853_c0_g1_i1:23-1873(+)
MLPTTMNQPRPPQRSQGRSAWRRITGHKVLLSLVTLFLLSLLSLVVITSIDNPINDDKIITIIKDISVDEEALREQTKGKPKTDTNHANTDDRKNNNDGVGEDPYKDKDDDKKNEYVDPYKTETDPKKDEHKDNTNTNNNNHNKYKFVKRHDVVVEPEVGEDKENIRRREAVKKAFVHAYDGYENHCFGQDEYRPSSKQCANWLNLGLTIVDSLDTMLIMGLEDHFSRARDWVRDKLDFNRDVSVSVFETNIRMVGGLLTVYDFTGDELFLRKSEECAKKLMPAFSTPSGLPKASVNLRSGATSLPSWTGGAAILAEVGTMQMEFAYLSQYVNNSIYAETALKVMDVLHAIKPSDSLYPMYVEVAPAKFRGGHVSLGAMGDSFYEYLLKLWLLFSKTKPLYRDMYYESADAIYKIMGQKLPKKDMFYVAEYNNGRKMNKHDHLACFTGGMFALGALHSDNPEIKKKHLEAGAGIAKFCYEMYRGMASGLSPEYVNVDVDSEALNPPMGDARAYIMRPETVETLFYMWRFTGEQKYRDWGWEIFEAIEKHCKASEGYTGLRDVTIAHPIKDDMQQSFFLAETLKYLYLLFSPDKYIPLDKYVFNTEAHPLSIFKPNF